MRVARLSLALAGLAAMLCVLAERRWRTTADLAALGPWSPIASAPSVRSFATAQLDSAVDATVTNDPFRLSNSPSSVPFSETQSESAAPAPVLMRPMFAVRAILGGPPWRAIVDGIPGALDGTMVAPGASFDRLRVRAITRDTVVIQGPDTTWKLTLKRGTP